VHLRDIFNNKKMTTLQEALQKVEAHEKLRLKLKRRILELKSK
jgi:hypothetical protein